MFPVHPKDDCEASSDDKNIIAYSSSGTHLNAMNELPTTSRTSKFSTGS